MPSFRRWKISIAGTKASNTFDSNGSKHSLYNALGALIDPGDEVILLAPYWFWGGIPAVVKSNVFDAFVPAMEDFHRRNEGIKYIRQ